MGSEEQNQLEIPSVWPAPRLSAYLDDKSPTLSAAACQALGKLPRAGAQEASRIARRCFYSSFLLKHLYMTLHDIYMYIYKYSRTICDTICMYIIYICVIYDSYSYGISLSLIVE